MEPRRWRPMFFNPFTERKFRTDYIPLYRGLFRVLPLHIWAEEDINKILGYVALNPSLFGLPEQSTCIVNTAYFLPSLRSRTRGVCVFGRERGCKSIVVPSSCSNTPFDALDAKLIEPLFRKNPSVEYVYLSQHCQPMAMHLVPYLSRCQYLRKVTLEGWTDAVAIHKVMMACRQADVLDTFSLDDTPRQWKDELPVQALTTLIEMHPNLRSVQSHRAYLMDWFEATRWSRCKHNVALVVYTCDFVLLFMAFFALVLCVPAYLVATLVHRLCNGRLSQHYTRFWSVIAFVSTLAALVTADVIGWKVRGRGWVHMQKYFILAKRRIDIIMNVHQTALAKV